MKGCENKGKGNFVCHTVKRLRILLFPSAPVLLLAAKQTLKNHIDYFSARTASGVDTNIMFLFFCPPFDHITVTLTACFWHQGNPLGVLWCKNCVLWEAIQLEDMLCLCLSLHFTKSQDGWGWEGLLQAILSAPAPSVAQAQSARAGRPGPCPVGYYLQGWRLHSLLGDLFQCLTTLTVKKVSFCVQVEFHVFQFVSVESCPVIGNCTEESDLFLFPPIKYLYTLIRCLWGLSSPGWTDAALSTFPHMKDVPVP